MMPRHKFADDLLLLYHIYWEILKEKENQNLKFKTIKSQSENNEINF